MPRLPLLHPEGLRLSEGPGPAHRLRRATKLSASLVSVGRKATVWVDETSLHVLLDSARIKTLPSRAGVA